MNETATKTPMLPTKREQREASLERILDSALKLIVSRGFHSTTVDDIARSAGLTKGAVYFYFENKNAVLLALLDIIEKMIVDGMIERVSQAGPRIKDKLVAAVHSQGILAERKAKYLLLFILVLL